MKKMLLTVCLLALSSITLLGCRGEVEVDDEVSTPLSLPR